MVDQNIQDGFKKIENDKEKVAIAITNKGVSTKATDTLETMASNIDKISSGGGSEKENTLKSILEGTYETLEDNEVTSITGGVFYSYAPLKKISLSNAETIGANAFYNCSLLTEIIAPKLKTIESGVFYAYQGEDLNLENLIEAKGNNFVNNSSLKTINFPKLERIDGKFCSLPSNFTIPEVISFPFLSYAYASSFYGKKASISSSFNNLCKKINLPLLESGSLSGFFGGDSTTWNNLEEIYCPKVPRSMAQLTIPSWLSSPVLQKVVFSTWFYCTKSNWSKIISCSELKTLDMRNLNGIVDYYSTSNIEFSTLTEDEASLKNTKIETLYLDIFSPDLYPEKTGNTGTTIRTSYIYKGCSNLKYLIFQSKECIGALDVSIIPSTLKAMVFLQNITKEVYTKPDISELPQEMYIYVTDYSYTQLTEEGSVFAPKLRKISEYKDLLETEYNLDLTIYPSDED